MRAATGNGGSTNPSHGAAWVVSRIGSLSSRGTRRPGLSSPQEPDRVGALSFKLLAVGAEIEACSRRCLRKGAGALDAQEDLRPQNAITTRCSISCHF